jgi:predicted enzyme related to lactoylglutathione lyase
MQEEQMRGRSEYQPGVFCWVDLMARDAKALEPFYTKLFGWTAHWHTLAGGPEYCVFHYQGKEVTGMAQMPFIVKMAGLPTTWSSYISVDDADELAARARALGGSITFPPMDVATSGRVAFLKDPEGAAFAVWQKRDKYGAQLGGELCSWSWNELMTHQPVAAEKFYGELFGWNFASMQEGPEDGYRIIQHPSAEGGVNGGLLPLQSAQGQLPASWRVYFRVDKLNASLEKVNALGGTVQVAPFICPVGTIATISDPQGALFNLIQMIS